MPSYKRGTSLYDYCISENKQWILEQFDLEKNVPPTPHDFTKSSDKKALFKITERCEVGYGLKDVLASWELVPSSFMIESKINVKAKIICKR